MSGNTIAFIEMLIPFALVLAFLTWQLVVTKRSLREDQERAAREPREQVAPVRETAIVTEAALLIEERIEAVSPEEDDITRAAAIRAEIEAGRARLAELEALEARLAPRA
ncbi:hypothetical protein CCR94_06295 [Rhodoblastus sphagnicola]|uniref:Uncharacterized protein n=1 Tax=Rhodoblastus sphagnicola TaxID=333368 RepID=A0A2S6NCC4_9HYPH|nr:hypothetical protein [Rhodoblastus sphagnicola]MBB4196813.1 hypothetical protein [Rhodoblastus sphagnicola]PPQ32254.1 hypothetical protein CCR94_06295 [Rhodoblastus sphagnicola]